MSNIFSNLSLDLDLDIDDTSSTLSAPPSSLSSVHTPSTIFASPSQSPRREQCHFEQVPRINAATFTNEEIVRRVHETCVINGIPLVVENWHMRKEWRKDIFSLDWLRANVAHMAIEARDILSSTDQTMFLGEYLDYVQKFYTNPSDRLRGLLYGKDILCPKEWSNLVNRILPEYFHYNGKNDMMAYIPTKLRAKNLMMYVGVEGTRTPAHKDMCAAFGHNLMVHAEEGASATWYLVGRGDKDKVAHFFTLHGQNIDLEKYFIPESALIEANFTVYKTEQRIGDFVLVPSNSCHQVVNNGKCSVKVSWNRVIAQTVKEAIESAIPNYQHVCRPETYRVRTVIRHTVEYWSNLAWKLYRCKYRGRQMGFDHTFGVRDFQYEYEIVLDLFKRICEDEFIRHDDWNGTVEIKKAECDATFVCDFCQCDIFNRFFTCTFCTARRSEDYVICMECYLNGRNCRHAMELCEKLSMRVLIDIYKEGKLGYEVYWGKKEGVTELDHNKELVYWEVESLHGAREAPTFPLPFTPIQYYIRPILPSVKQKKVRRRKPNRPKASKKLPCALDKPPCACSRCRRMKRRCDRAIPCGACVKAKVERFCDVGGSVGFQKEIKDDGQLETR
ncbi:9426_t:CDS:10, partial [Paraglomus brasilianum]